MQRPVENQAKTLIRDSGNSDVDLTVNIEIETKAIAYGMMCSLFAKGELDEIQLEKAVRKLDALIDRDKNRKKNKSTSGVSRPKIFQFPN
ncbi:hypothetical protein M3182_02420 [Mesobacillus maritimus]|uniref:hypothetical protein n=1 Tax=Mesobacillus maritimus TaxID=1643336 RepID=UPI0020416A43|nr:hypothetical protein [Mesobacillus maritimus]MCM3584597.1 hypothetical protein [Mesobacillus maritimus]MCM3671427.1 hypothetical protein [Mesobacillus maritimus]